MPVSRSSHTKMKTQRVFRSYLVAAALLFSPACSVHADEPFTITTDHIYGHKAGVALTLDVVRPTKDANGIGLLYMVSRGWVSNYFDLHEAMATSQQRNGRFFSLIDRGYTLFMVRHGSAPYFKVPDAVSDVRRALRYVRFNAAKFNVDPDRLGAFGNSAGGHLALMLGTMGDDGDKDSPDSIERTPARVSAVVAYYPPVDLRQTGLDTITLERLRSGPLDFDAALQESVSPVAHVSSEDAPTLLVHGDKDATVPLRNSVRMRDALQKSGVETELIVMEGAGHAFPGQYGSRAASALSEWFDQHLLDRPQP